MSPKLAFLFAIIVAVYACPLPAEENVSSVTIDGTGFQVAEGWTLRRVAAEPLVRYPVHADVAPDGSLFVLESSGSSAPVAQQLEDRTHRLVVLRDTDGDGEYDQRTVFAEGLMLPHGVLWTPDGILVGTPPEIWRLRDTNGDGTADEREIWFDGETATGCANDLHGPFFGREGRIYWTKGAFAEQQHPQADGSVLKTRASHLFRRDPQSGTVESMMTGGMDNPVEFAMSMCGERFFTCTFIQQPADGLRDAVVHAVYGGVYGKDHGVLEGHPRTGPLMPVMTHLGPAAPTGLTVREAALSDDDMLGELLAAHFNLQKITRHKLVEDGATFRTIDSDFLVADRPDFHPTDVLEDRDGSLLVIDTGGWYTLCCPTSRVDQSRAVGGIYRLTQDEGPSPTQADVRSPTGDQLIVSLGSPLPMVRQDARRRLLGRSDAFEILRIALTADAESLGPLRRSAAVWTLIELGDRNPPKREQVCELLVTLLDAPEPTVRLAATQGLGMFRYSAAAPRLMETLERGSPRERRYAAEALGRFGDPAATEALIARLPEDSGDRVLQHALLYALIEIGEPAAGQLRQLLDDESPLLRASALRVLDAIHDDGLEVRRVLELLASDDAEESRVAGEVLAGREQWDDALAQSLPDLLKRKAQARGDAADDEAAESWRAALSRLILRPGLGGAVAGVIADGPAEARDELLTLLARRPPTSLPEPWTAAVSGRLRDKAAEADELRRWAKVLGAVNWKESPPEEFLAAYREAVDRAAEDAELWFALQAAAPRGLASPARKDDISDDVSRMIESIESDTSPVRRQLALAALTRRKLSDAEAARLAEISGDLGPMELTGVLDLLRPRQELEINRVLLESLRSGRQWEALPGHLLEEHFREHPEEVQKLAAPVIESKLGDEPEKRRRHLARLMEEMPAGDEVRGLQIFRGSKAACSACHAVGYVGGKIGPDLTRINQIRSEADLLEAIVYPSASFVRSYESFQVLTDDGRAVSGIIADEDPGSITLVTGVDQRMRIDRDEVQSIRPSPVSIMPAGLEQQLTLQELADLIAFLKSERKRYPR